MSDQKQIEEMQKLLNKINKRSKEQQELLQESLTNVHKKLDRLEWLIFGVALLVVVIIGMEYTW